MKYKKIVLSLLLLLGIFVISGCEKVEKEGLYKEGTYFGNYVDTYGGSNSVATAVIYVNKSGKIVSVFADTVYEAKVTKEEVDTTTEEEYVLTTKKTLGNDYNMKIASEAGKEWFEQVNIIEEKVITEQGLDWFKINEDEKTDSISGVTMKVNAIYQAISNALVQAKK